MYLQSIAFTWERIQGDLKGRLTNCLEKNRRKKNDTQYILTEQEYRVLVSISEVNNLKREVRLLNDKVMELSEYPCESSADYGSVNFYCDDCPIGLLGTGTCTKGQRYSK